MKYFEKYVSNTLAGCGHPMFFNPDDPDGVQVGRVYLKPFVNGDFEYSLLYNNIIDTTFGDGTVSHCNLVCDEWTVDGLRAAAVPSCEPDETDEGLFQTLTFDGKESKTVRPGEFFHTDPFRLAASPGEWICVEISYHGRQIPCHPECQVPVFRRREGVWQADMRCPLPCMTGCVRNAAARIGFLGDSITQGIGATFNSYRHYAAVTAELVGDKYSYWNLGLGFARAADAAADGAWLFKAKQMDVVTVCLGVNDSGRSSADDMKRSLYRTVTQLKKAGVRVLLQTVPPYEYDEQREYNWREVNKYIEQELPKVADCIFRQDFLAYPGDPARSRFGGHPNDEGCALWAEHLAPVLSELLEKE